MTLATMMAIFLPAGALEAGVFVAASRASTGLGRSTSARAACRAGRRARRRRRTGRAVEAGSQRVAVVRSRGMSEREPECIAGQVQRGSCRGPPRA